MTRFADLEELRLRVRDPLVARLFSEAASGYESNALRGAIVTLWTAVVFDIVAKLRELELGGDKEAQSHLKKFEAARAHHDVESALRFERDILSVARDQFELLTPQEFDDLRRLQEDRNRCAHPSMNSAEEAYMPSAELVRYHLRSAAEHLFVRPPVQGKAALERLFSEVTNPFFPRDPSAAARILEGTLGRAKATLIRNFLLASAKEVLVGESASSPAAVAPILTALAATKQLQPALTSNVIRDEFPRLAQRVPGEHVGRILWVALPLPEVLEHLRPDTESRVDEYAKAVPTSDLNPHLLVALRNPRFEPAARVRLDGLEWSDLVQLVSKGPMRLSRHPEIVSRVVDTYCNSLSWNMSNELGPKAIVPLATILTKEQVQQILAAMKANGELTYAHTSKQVLPRLREVGQLPPTEFDALGNKLGLGENFP